MENTERKTDALASASAAANSSADLAHEAFMKDKGIETIDLPEKLQEADEILKEAKKDDFESANEVSRLLMEALQESIYEINETIEQIGETLTDHEQRIEALEEAPSPEGELMQVPQAEVVQEVAPQRKLSKEEQILADLYASGTTIITKPELKVLGFNVGFFSNLSVRGGKYGSYELKKAPSEKVYEILKNE